MSDIARIIGKRLRGYRAAQGLSQERLAERAGLHPTYIGQVERGEKNLTVESLEKIMRALGVPMAEVFEVIEEQNEERNYPRQAYELLLARSPEQQESLINILSEIDKLSR